MSDRLFFSTRWGMILKAGDSRATTLHAFSALSELCEVYWRPVYGFLRKKGYSDTDAQDLTQGFFVHLMENRRYARADREKGRFRSFLLAVLKHFLADARDREHAMKRGGGIVLENLDENAQAQIEGATWPADEVYDREWAASLVRQALDRLAQECVLVGKADLLNLLMPRLVAKDDVAVRYTEMARRSHRSVATLRHERVRLGARFREILREEVRATVPDATEVDDELRYLCRVLATT
jgi:RNA polymerase sigma factor (sigma-70 family)